MQIDGKYHSDYHSYPKREYQYTGGTKEDAEEVRKDEQSGTSRGKWQGDSGVIVELSNQNNLVKESINAGREAGSENTASFIKKGIGVFQGFWKSLEEDDKAEMPDEVSSNDRLEIDGEKVQEDIVEETGLQRGIGTIISEIKQFFGVQVADKVNALVEKLKVGIQTTLKRFGKDSEPFGALTDPGTGSLLGGRTGSEGKGKRRNGEQGQEASVDAKAKREEHLMDSYSKSGKYCKINENLTYQQGRAPYKVSEKISEHDEGDSF